MWCGTEVMATRCRADGPPRIRFWPVLIGSAATAVDAAAAAAATAAAATAAAARCANRPHGGGTFRARMYNGRHSSGRGATARRGAIMQALIANPYAGEVGGLTRWMATAHAPAVGPPGGVAAGPLMVSSAWPWVHRAACSDIF